MALIACQAPVAGDLRLAIALLHVNDRIERIGAQCVNIAKLCCATPVGSSQSPRQLECLSSMAALVGEQLGESAAIFRERDGEGVQRVRDQDLEINRLNRRCFEIAIQDGADETRREVAFFGALMARALERIGDNTVDIAQQAAFAATGRLRAPASP